MLDFFKNKRILITGSTGFKGSWLSYLLSSNVANVYGYALKPPLTSNFNILNIEKKIHQMYGDIRDRKELSSYFDTVKPERSYFNVSTLPSFIAPVNSTVHS